MVRCSVHLQMISSFVQCKFSFNCYPGSKVNTCTFAKSYLGPLWVNNVSMCHNISEFSSSSVYKCILLIYKLGVTYSSKLDLAILATFCPTVKQPVPELQHVASKTVSLMCQASSQLIQCGNWEEQEVWIKVIYKFHSNNCGVSQS